MLTLASYLADNARPVYERIAGYLGDWTGEPVELSAAPWGERVRMMDEDRVDGAFMCGLPYSQRHDAGRPPLELLCAPVMAAARYGGRPVYFTDVIVRHDSPFERFADLRGRRFAYNGVDSNSGYVMPRDHLLTLGETSGYFKEAVASGAHQKSIDMVVAGKADASGIDSTVLELELAHRPELGPALRVVESIGPCPIPPVVVASRLDNHRKARLRTVFLTMHENPEGRRILAAGLTARFVPVRDADYDPIRAMVRRAETAGFLTLR